MAKAVILKTNHGTYIIGSLQCSNGAYWTAENCYKYCDEESDFLKAHQASKLIEASTKLGHDKVLEDDWYKNRDNFVDVEISFETSQKYKDSDSSKYDRKSN